MSIKIVSHDLILVELPGQEPEITDELTFLNKSVCPGSIRNVIVDFKGAEIVVSSGISELLVLRDHTRKIGRRLILCNVSVPTRCIFAVAGLVDAFEFAPDRPAALADLQAIRC